MARNSHGKKAMDSVRIVEEFWSAVWKARNPEAAAHFIVDDFVITTGGVDIVAKRISSPGCAVFSKRSMTSTSK